MIDVGRRLFIVWLSFDRTDSDGFNRPAFPRAGSAGRSCPLRRDDSQPPAASPGFRLRPPGARVEVDVMKPRTAIPRKNPRPPSAAVAPGGMSERALDKLTDVFKSLADKNRLKILQILSGAGEMHVSALCQHLSQSQPAVSHHLTQLRNAGL